MMLDSDHGFSRFSVPLGPGITPTAIRFDDADTNAGNNWTVSTANNAITWTMTGANSLDWGTMYHFEFVASAAPAATGTVSLTGIATASEPEIPYTLGIIVPQATNDTI